MDSRKKPYSGFCRRLRSVFSALADEADSSDRPKVKLAADLIEKLTPCKRLMIAGFLGDVGS